MKNRPIILIAVILLAAMALPGCGGETTPATTTGTEAVAVAKDGDTVTVDYVGTLDDDSQFDSSYDRGEPLEFVLGAGNMISGFEDAVRGMKVGEKKTVTLPPDEAYGYYRDDLVFTMGWEQFPEDIELEIGQQVPLQADTGAVFYATVIDISDAGVTMDANSTLAGETLTFEIELVSIEPGE